MGGLTGKFGLGGGFAGRRGPGWPVAAAIILLSVLVIASFFLYLSRLSGASSGENDAGGQTFTRDRERIGAPENVTVTVDKGATVSWEGEDDVRIIGYNIYRYKAGDDPGSKVNAAIISDTVYHDD